MQNAQSIEFLNKIIYTKRGIKKGMEQTSKRSIFKNRYNKGYIEAITNELDCLSKLKDMIESEQDQDFVVKLDSIRKGA